MNPCSKCGTPNFHPRVLVKSDDILQQLRSSVGFGDQVHVNSLLHDAEKDLDDYDTEIARLETAISILKHKRARLEGHIARFRSLLSPIRRLPPEILGLIFLLRCEETGNNFTFAQHYIHLPAVVLSQVCTDWRKVASNTPSIWSNLRFGLGWEYGQFDDLSNQEFIALILPLINLCFERSSQVLLDLSVYFWNFWENDGFESILKTITSTSHRWRSLDLWSQSESGTEVFCSQITELSSLECFDTDLSTLELFLGF
ncbi:hypothetical protein K435DRAFT_699140, partial [Dendrothele bispora CBS 962.96]